MIIILCPESFFFKETFKQVLCDMQRDVDATRDMNREQQTEQGNAVYFSSCR